MWDFCTLSLKNSLLHSSSQNEGTFPGAVSASAQYPALGFRLRCLLAFSLGDTGEQTWQTHHWFGGTSNSGLFTSSLSLLFAFQDPQKLLSAFCPGVQPCSVGGMCLF